MVQITRTTNPIPLQDLEPHRFEDLVRQLLYDFRNWRRLEPTGRSGSDDGFDARGWEITGSQMSPVRNDEDDEENEEQQLAETDDRIWLIQCKRERRIGPTQIRKYVNDIPEEAIKNVYGMILVVATDFSKKARDEFREACRNRGVQEWYLWGRSDVEDMLFRPANDHLLFAYFGFSLQVRKRSMKALWSSRMTTKRRAKKHLAEYRYRHVLVRDAADDRYPYLDENEKLDRIARGRWKFYQFDKVRHNGISLVTRSFFAYIGEDGESWDYIKATNLAEMDAQQDPWVKEDRRDWEVEAEGRAKWMTLTETNRATFSVKGVIPYDNVVVIDELGDEYYNGVHLLVSTWDLQRGPFETFSAVAKCDAWGGRRLYPANDDDRRIAIFDSIVLPDQIPSSS